MAHGGSTTPEELNRHGEKPRNSIGTHIAIIIVSNYFLRWLFGRIALRHLYRLIWLKPTPLAFLILGYLGSNRDPVFVSYALDLLLKVPRATLENYWISAAGSALSTRTGGLIKEDILLARSLIERLFGLWTLYIPKTDIDAIKSTQSEGG